MNSKHRRTLVAIFAEPVSGSLDWASIEALLMSVGCELVEGSGSRVRFNSDGAVATFHRPHPAKEAKRYQIRAARDYLIKIGIEP
ncbi:MULTISPECIES: type II toxin-antitoxin system HicA family toxin [unclassified Aurantimonas]|uniref:type II toxin-antitoxin system HicA family toxin n=1 Tax=unclassified Aurantimonas TaxID=2638230 RepID=UPI002E17B6EC|nr:type II toxin-antitoxin system HicA family toxin [Aurantimonas sp. A3-2-R12]